MEQIAVSRIHMCKLGDVDAQARDLVRVPPGTQKFRPMADRFGVIEVGNIQ